MQTKYDPTTTPILVEGYSRDGCTHEEVAGKLGISRNTLWEWAKRYPDVADALKKGAEVVDYQVEMALLKKALSGDTVACIFWLKNRKRTEWRDKPAEEAPDMTEALGQLVNALRDASKSASATE